MPRYLFSVEDHLKLQDLDGEILADDLAASELANATAHDLARDSKFDGCRVVARNERREIVAEASIDPEPGSLRDRLNKLRAADKK